MSKKTPPTAETHFAMRRRLSNEARWMLRAGNFFSRRPAAKRRRGAARSPRTRWLSFEPLEPKQMLAADVIVSEIMYQSHTDTGDPEDYGEEFIERIVAYCHANELPTDVSPV